MKIFIRIILSLLSFILILLLGLTIFFMHEKKNGNVPYIFDYSSFVNEGTSMLPTIKENDLLIIKKEGKYDKDDIITFINDEKIVVTHRIIDEKEDKYITKGDNNKFIDGYEVEYFDIYGKVIFTMPNIGKSVEYLNNNKNLIIPFLIGVILISLLLTKFSRR